MSPTEYIMQALAGCYTATLTMMAAEKGIDLDGIELDLKEGANKQVISSQADSLIKISRIWAD
ncbi:OsmC family protein, partial [Escherichia coli]